MDLEDFDSTLYFLDESEINQVAPGGRGRVSPRRPHLRAQRPVRPLRARGRGRTIGREMLGILEPALPQFPQRPRLPDGGRGPPRDQAARRARARASPPAAASRGSTAFVAKLSEPAIVSQLLQSLDEAPSLAGEADVAEVLRELRATALEPVADAGFPTLASPGAQDAARGRGRPAGERPHRPRCSASSARRNREALARWWRSAADSGCIRPCPDWARP